MTFILDRVWVRSYTHTGFKKLIVATRQKKKFRVRIKGICRFVTGFVWAPVVLYKYLFEILINRTVEQKFILIHNIFVDIIYNFCFLSNNIQIIYTKIN